MNTSKQPVIVTRDSLQHMLENNDQERVAQVIGRALVVLFKRQTAAEQNNNSTLDHNNVGFTGVDGKSGAITAKYFLKHHTLLPWQIRMWSKPAKNGYARLVKYHSQINEAAVEKAALQQTKLPE